jgi:hypothetical protein
MLQTCDVGCCVEEEERGGLLMLDVARNTGRNMGHLGVVSGEDGGEPLMLDVARNMACWTFDLMTDLLPIR